MSKRFALTAQNVISSQYLRQTLQSRMCLQFFSISLRPSPLVSNPERPVESALCSKALIIVIFSVCVKQLPKPCVLRLFSFSVF